MEIIKIKLNTQHGATIMTKSSNYNISRDNNKYVYSKKDKKKENPCRKFGKHWTPRHRCEDVPL